MLFKGVDSVDAPTAMDHLSIRRNDRRFTLRGDGWSGHVEAIAMFAIEDDGQYYDPSKLYVGP